MSLHVQPLSTNLATGESEAASHHIIEQSTARQLKVLHVIPSIAPRYGGPSAAILSLVSELNQVAGVQAEIATTDADGHGGRLKPHDVDSTAPIHMFRHSWSEQWKLSTDLLHWLRRYAAQYDVIHIHAIWSFASAAAARVAAKRCVPYIVRPAGMLSAYSWNRESWKKQVYWSLVERQTISQAAAFHATSASEADEIKAVASEARVFVIPNGVDHAAFVQEVDRETLKSQCGTSDTGLPIVLFLSRLHPKKGIIDLLLPAAKLLKLPHLLVIAGAPDPSTPHHDEEVRRTILELGLERQVVMLGEVKPSQRWEMFDGADLFVLPSHAENFGIAVAEAMSRKCPVVVTDTVQSSGHVLAARAGEVVTRDVSTLTRAMERMLADPSQRQTCGESGHAYAAEHFDWAKVARQVTEMYRSCHRLA